VTIALELTPGVDVAAALSGDIDRDHDGRFSPEERSAYVDTVVSDLRAEIDRGPVHLRPIRSSFPDPSAMRAGEGAIRVQTEANLSRLSEGAHRLFFRNAHHPDISVYLANALVPKTNDIVITRLQRDPDQRELTIDFAVKGR
jgi:hypothetical protein